MEAFLRTVTLLSRFHVHFFHQILMTSCTAPGLRFSKAKGHSSRAARHIYAVEADHLPEMSSDTSDPPQLRKDIRTLVGGGWCGK